MKINYFLPKGSPVILVFDNGLIENGITEKDTIISATQFGGYPQHWKTEIEVFKKIEAAHDEDLFSWTFDYFNVLHITIPKKYTQFLGIPGP